MIHQASQGLASLGRNGDSMLVHMSPKEVAGLQGLAMAQGGSLTINPDTGLPEAFNLGNFITSLIPTAVGAMVGGPAGASWGLQAGSGWATAAPILAGAATGAAIAGIKGEDPLMGGIMGGVGGYGGADLGKAFGAATNPGITNTISSNIGKSIGDQVDNLASSTALNSVQGGKAGIDFSTLAQSGGAPGINLSPSQIAQGSLGETRGALAGFTPQAAGGTSSAMDTASRFVDNVGMPKLAMTGAGALLGGLEPSDLYSDLLKSKEDKYDPYATLNLSGDTGLRLYALGGAVGNPSVGGGLSDLYNRPEGQALENISNDGYGIGRLDRLASAEAMNNAKTLGYTGGGAIAFEKGGYLNGAGDGMSDSIPATIEGKQPARLADGEFVVPADVVSHIGNGSSRAGSKRLYKMLDKVRHARTGTKKQGREINPNKYLPA